MSTTHAHHPSAPEPTSSPFPFSPSSYTLPLSITSPTNPTSSLLPTNSPTFLVHPSSPLKPPPSPPQNSYETWLHVQNTVSAEPDHDDLILFPTYHAETRPFPSQDDAARLADLDLDEADSLDDDDASTLSGSGSDDDNSNDDGTSSRSSSPCLSDASYDEKVGGGGECDCELQSEALENPSWAPEDASPPFIFAEDDMAVSCAPPTRCVDFLAHEWEGDDLWTSYKHVRSTGRGMRGSRRLANALWRTWGRGYWGCGRVDPGVIHWLKDTDITWLYGPFLPASASVSQYDWGIPRTSSTLASPSLSPSSSSSPLPSTNPTNTKPLKSLLKKTPLAKRLQDRSQHTLHLLREATASEFPCPSPAPVSGPVSQKQARSLRAVTGCLDSENAHSGPIDLEMRERKRRVAFNEVVLVFREVVEGGEVEC